MLPSVSPISGCCADDDNRVGGGSGKKKPLNVDRCLRDYFNRTNLDLFLIGLFFTVYSSHYATQASEVSDSTGGQELDGAATTLADRLSENSTVGNQSEFEQKESSSDDTVLFPWFAQIIGVLIYYFLSRYVHSLPYTAVMFVIGFAMGFSMVRHNGSENILRESWISWMNIPGQLLLAVFLPGLLYIDAYHIDGEFKVMQLMTSHTLNSFLFVHQCLIYTTVHLFINSFMQLLLLAFPMVRQFWPYNSWLIFTGHSLTLFMSPP
jgi:F0F1-type ATP synthase assembly protein I